jgi:hypothetical protein
MIGRLSVALLIIADIGHGGQADDYRCSVQFLIVRKSDTRAAYKVASLRNDARGELLSHCSQLQCRDIPYDLYHYTLVNTSSGDERRGDVFLTESDQVVTVSAGPTADVRGVPMIGFVKDLPKGKGACWIRFENLSGNETKQVIVDAHSGFRLRSIGAGRWLVTLVQAGEVLLMDVVDVRMPIDPPARLVLNIGLKPGIKVPN